jgi:thioredoxin
MSDPIKIDSTNFEAEVIKSDVPVLVDFWAPWCGPCKMLTPTIEALATEYEGKAKVVKVNVDDNQQLAGEYGIRGIPTVMVFKDGQMINSMVGMKPKEELAMALDAAL